MQPKIIFSGSSTSCSHNNKNKYLWNTWKDICIKSYGIANYIDICYPGQGNESICTRSIVEIEKHKASSLILCMQITGIDKFDWLIPKHLLDNFNEEKHKPIDVMGNNNFKYWCTGCYFPSVKKIYKDNFYSLDHAMLNSIKHIWLVISYCSKHNIPLLIIPDSPIFAFTESELITMENKLPVKYDPKRLISELTEVFYNEIKNFVDHTGILGYNNNKSNNIWHKKFEHVGPKQHYDYFKQYIKPFIDQFFNNYNSIEQEIQLEARVFAKDSH